MAGFNSVLYLQYQRDRRGEAQAGLLDSVTQAFSKLRWGGNFGRHESYQDMEDIWQWQEYRKLDTRVSPRFTR